MVTTRTNLTTRRHVGRKSPISLIGIHTMEAPEAKQTAENVAQYFKRVNASAHWCVDNDSRVRVVDDKDTAWTLPGANSRSLNIEIAGYAKQDPDDWADKYSIDALDNAALCAAEWCEKYDIPIRKLTDEQIRSGAKGFVGHVDVNRVYKQSTHWDPGPSFPWDYFLGRVSHFLKKQRPEDPKPADKKPSSWDNKGFSRAYIRQQQTMLKALDLYDGEIDGYLGAATTEATRKFQRENGLEVDGLPGPATTKKLKAATIKQLDDATAEKLDDAADKKSATKPSIKALQSAVGAVPDNNWGPDTDKRLRVVMASSAYAGRKFPFGIKYTQSVVKTRQDGFWGMNSVAAHDRTVTAVQHALKDLGYYKGNIDALWGPQLTAAYSAARKDFRK